MMDSLGIFVPEHIVFSLSHEVEISKPIDKCHFYKENVINVKIKHENVLNNVKEISKIMVTRSI